MQTTAVQSFAGTALELGTTYSFATQVGEIPLTKRTIEVINIIGLFGGIIFEHPPNFWQAYQLPLSTGCFFIAQPITNSKSDCSDWAVLVSVEAICQLTTPSAVETESKHCY